MPRTEGSKYLIRYRISGVCCTGRQRPAGQRADRGPPAVTTAVALAKNIVELASAAVYMAGWRLAHGPNRPLDESVGDKLGDGAHLVPRHVGDVAQRMAVHDAHSGRLTGGVRKDHYLSDSRSSTRSVVASSNGQ
jgi:hypothetical protein